MSEHEDVFVPASRADTGSLPADLGKPRAHYDARAWAGIIAGGFCLLVTIGFLALAIYVR